jgi:nitrate/nitrite-specific signal transduction histidine kinase
MRSGVLFYKPDGFVLLSNAKMQELMLAMTGVLQRNGRRFCELLASGEMRPNCLKTEDERQTIYTLPDKSVWMFTRTELRIRGRRYIQLTATDITERYHLTEKLRQQERLLELRSKQLKDTIANLQTLSRERELQKAQLRAHDRLGQRLTLLLRAVRNNQNLDIGLLRSLSKGLKDDLYEEENRIIPKDMLKSLRQTFEAFGVQKHIDGELPDDVEKGSTLAGVISEGIVNAVRHGFAAMINVLIENSQAGCLLEISDNGNPQARPVIEGGGIGAMRSAAERHGGTLDVKTEPNFTLKMFLPIQEGATL